MRTLSEIVIYPVKSCAGVSVPSAKLTDRGLEGDRRFMVVDASGAFVTQRGFPKLARVQARFVGAQLELSLDGAGVAVAAEPKGAGLQVKVWRSTVSAVDCGDEVAAWFSALLGAPMRLVYMPTSTGRTMNVDYAAEHEKVSFADGYPYLLTLESSLSELNARLSEPVPMDRFRPNLVLRGGKPWEEDAYDRLRIGALGFRVAKPCARCVIVTTEQDTGVQASKEPLRTLATYRTRDLGVIFGQNLIADRTDGVLTVGDAVHIRFEGDQPSSIGSSNQTN